MLKLPSPLGEGLGMGAFQKDENYRLPYFLIRRQETRRHEGTKTRSFL
jgi:hypothetical protein